LLAAVLQVRWRKLRLLQYSAQVVTPLPYQPPWIRFLRSSLLFPNI
jgi:hypothetical protein